MADPRRHTSQQRRARAFKRRLTAAAAVVVVGVGTGVGIAAAQASGGQGFRTGVAANGNAVRTITVSGTVQPVNEAQTSFQVSGTVTAVDVSVGQQVSAGQTLATLDTTSLQEQLSLAQATLATAQARLNQDEAGQAATPAETTSPAQTTSTAQTTGSTVHAAILTAANPGSTGTTDLTKAQQAVVMAQHSADTDIQSAAAALASADSACSSSQTTSPTTTPTTTSPTTTPPTSTPPTSTPPTTAPSSTTPTSSPSSSGSGGSGESAACTAALQQAYAAEQQVSRDQQNVQNAEKALAQILSSTSSSATSSPGKSSSGSTSKSSSGTNSAGPSGSATAANSAAQLATDQAAIDNDQATLVNAQQSLSSATLTAPISGTVGALTLSPGQGVSAGSTSSYVTVTNSGAYQATASLSTAQVGLVAVGDAVQVAVDGRSGTVGGTVTRVGPVAVSSSSYTYPLVVSLTGLSSGGIAGGSAAQVQVQVAHADDTLVVPTSAVHTSAPGRSYVIVLRSGKQIRTTVTKGVVGQLFTQITRGLSSGAVVVLADPSQPVPSSSTNSSTTFGRGFGGAGFVVGGGGFGGGAGAGGGRLNRAVVGGGGG